MSLPTPSRPRLQTAAGTVGPLGTASHVTFACRMVRSAAARALAFGSSELWRKLLSRCCFQLASHPLVDGTLPASSMLVTANACWFQIGRVLTQWSRTSASTCTPVAATAVGAGCEARHTLPAGDEPAIGSRQA